MAWNRKGSGWEGIYYKAEDWGENQHWAKDDRSAHIFLYVGDGFYFWDVDDRE